MPLILATGSNFTQAHEHLEWARKSLGEHFHLVAASRVYHSKPVDYLDQPDFLNQVLQFSLPWQSPENVMKLLLELEVMRGRIRDKAKGPRSLDLDIIFWGLDIIHSENLITPHPRWIERSFVVRPLSELPFWHAIEKCFTIPKSFEVEATPLS
jgi:2-amino-4-hydroxy-6-hydroxymethyldihydropteridine diphosphokinase